MQVSWTPRALKSYFNIADYLQIELGLNSVRSFILKVEKNIRFQTYDHLLPDKSQKERNNSFAVLG